MTRFAKAIVAFFTSLGAWGATAALDGKIELVEMFGLCGVIVVTASVYAWPNDTPAGEPHDPSVSERTPDPVDSEPDPTE